MATKYPIEDPMIDPRTGEYAVIAPGHNFKSVTQKIAGIVLTSNTPLGWFFGLIVAAGVATGLVVGVTWLFLKGTGIWGVTIPGAWGFAIINFVWWIGIGHAGTLISAILLLFKQTWRNSINRFAEAMTIFAVVCAGMFPLIHVGRPWLGYWLFPYPNTMNVWPQFRSPLAWDVFAVSTYASISVIFWYVGMIPDFGTLRDRATMPLAKYFYGMLSLGWRGSTRHWIRYESASLLLAGLSTPLVLSVHTVISFDFAVAALAGWHTTIFPPYFVAGAVYSGFAMVLTLAIPLRKFYHLEDLVTLRHLDNMAKVMIGTGGIVAYGYGMEVFMSWYSASHWEFFMMWNRMFGPMGWAYWILILTNIAIPLTTLWSRKLRVNVTYLFILSIIVNTGMWFERFVIVVTSLYREYLPSSWGTYRATKWDYMIYVGTMGLFTFLFFLFVRFLPMIPMSEVRMMLPQTKVKRGGPDAETMIEGESLMPPREGIYGLLAEFNTPSELVYATEQARRAGYRRMECYTPYPVEEAAEALHFHKTRVPLICLMGGVMGLTTAFLMETWINVWGYPLNIAGRPLFSWPAFIIPAYEWTILFAGFSAAFGMIAMNGLPQLYHPLFNAPNFRNGATTDKFFLCLEAGDPKFSLTETRAFLEHFAPVSVVEVDH